MHPAKQQSQYIYAKGPFIDSTCTHSQNFSNKLCPECYCSCSTLCNFTRPSFLSAAAVMTVHSAAGRARRTTPPTRAPLPFGKPFATNYSRTTVLSTAPHKCLSAMEPSKASGRLCWQSALKVMRSASVKVSSDIECTTAFLCSCISVQQRRTSQVDVHVMAATNLIVHLLKMLADVAVMLLPIARLHIRQ